jgi:hypothetical protein
MRLQNHQTVILACCKRLIKTDERTVLQELISRDVNWNDLLNEARSLEISPLLWWAFKDLDLSFVPQDVVTQLKFEYKQNFARNIVLSDRLAWLCRTFEGNDIPFVPIKGLILSDQTFPSEALRSLCDLDVLIQPENLNKAVEILTRNGLLLAENDSHFAVDLDKQRDIKFVGAMKGFDYVLELHWKFKDTFLKLEQDVVWSNLVDYKWNGLKLRVFSPELTLIHLIHHLHYQGFTLKILMDVAATLKSYQSLLDWEQVLRLANTFKMKWCVYLALKCASDLIDHPFPEGASGLKFEFQKHRRWMLRLLCDERWYFKRLAYAIQSYSYLRALFSVFFTDGNYLTLLKLLARRALWKASSKWHIPVVLHNVDH